MFQFLSSVFGKHVKIDLMHSACNCLFLKFILEYQFCSEVEEAIETYETLLKHIFEQAIPAVQDALQQFPTNLGVSKEGRHFLFNSSKMAALKCV